MDAIDAVRSWLGPGGERWVKGDYFSGDGACLMGAIALSYGELDAGLDDGLDTAKFLASVICDLFPERAGAATATVMNFNDHEDTTWSDVDLVLKHAAARMESGEGVPPLRPAG